MINIKITDVRAVPGDSAFLLDDGKTAILYDSGFAFTGYQVADNIKKVLGSRNLDYVLLTHSHYDHALGSAYIKKRYPNAKVVAGEYADRIFRKATARAVMRDLDRKIAGKYGVTEYEDLIDTLSVDIPVQDGDILQCGTIPLTVINLPGHTKCSVGYYLKESELLLATETLGVYFGEDVYLPSCLVGIQMTLDSIQKARTLNIQRILLPHYGLVERTEAKAYLDRSAQVVIETTRHFAQMLREGKTRDDILQDYRETVYTEKISPTYPIDAFLLNTGIMIDLVQKELVQNP